VKVQADKTLPDEVLYQNSSGEVLHFKVSYPWKPKNCSLCNSFRHNSESCSLFKKRDKAQTKADVVKKVHSNMAFVVNKKATSEIPSSSNPFNVLQNLDVINELDGGVSRVSVGLEVEDEVEVDDDLNKLKLKLMMISKWVSKVEDDLNKETHLNSLPSSQHNSGAPIPPLETIFKLPTPQGGIEKSDLVEIILESV